MARKLAVTLATSASEVGVVAEFLGVNGGLAMDDPAHVAGAVRAEGDG